MVGRAHMSTQSGRVLSTMQGSRHGCKGVMNQEVGCGSMIAPFKAFDTTGVPKVAVLTWGAASIAPGGGGYLDQSRMQVGREGDGGG